MSEAPPDTCDVDALLSEVVALDMALLRHVNAVALATTDPDALNGLVRSQQRLARSVRTTLATKAKLARERSDDRPDALPIRTPCEREAPDDEVGYDPGTALLEEVIPAIRLEYDPAEADAIEYELDDLLDEVWGPESYERRLPAERVARFMHHIRKTFGLSKTVRPPAELPSASVRMPEAGDTPPHDHPPGVPDPGGGSG